MMNIKNILLALALSILLFASWAGLARLWALVIPYRWIETALIFITLPVLFILVMKIANKLDKKS